MSENKKMDEMHGCIVCARLFSILVVYTPDGEYVECSLTGHEARVVADKFRPLVACANHTQEDINAAHKLWRSRHGSESNHPHEKIKSGDEWISRIITRY